MRLDAFGHAVSGGGHLAETVSKLKLSEPQRGWATRSAPPPISPAPLTCWLRLRRGSGQAAVDESGFMVKIVRADQPTSGPGL
jgi:hypothetical protein